MTDLIYPTLDLFLYDLRNGLGETREEIERNQAIFQKKLPASVGTALFESDTAFETEYTELLPKSKIVPFQAEGEPYSLQGYYYPVRLGDTYGLLVDCSAEEQVEPQPAETFAALKAEIEQNRLQGELATIGQTWMMSGWLPSSEAKSAEAVAKACYQAIAPGSNWQGELRGSGQFMGAAFFELSRYRVLMKEGTSYQTSIQDLQENWHAIIIIYPDRATAEKAAQFYFEWMQLFEYRHKILWCYGQSRLAKQVMKGYFAEIQASQRTMEENAQRGREFQKLREMSLQIQQTLNRYAIDWGNLEFQSRTIDINLSNYKKRWARIEEKAKNLNAESESNLAFLDEFGQLVTDKYLFQIQKDAENLQQGRQLLGDMTNAINSRVEVEKAERDRNFQEIITILGVAWSVASFVADPAELAQVANQDVNALISLLLGNFARVPEAVLHFILPLAYPLSVAFIAAAVTWSVRRFWKG